MGMDLKVRFAREAPHWNEWTGLLATRQAQAQIRMIDGLPAFPDEVPTSDWREIRVSILGNMITFRREADGVRLVTWGNATGDSLRAWHLAAWAMAKASDGQVLINDREQSVADFEAGYLTPLS